MNENKTTEMTGVEYFQKAIGSSGHKPAVYSKHHASHYTVIRKVYEEALTRFPEAADVIAALVFFRSLDREREAFLAKQEDQHDR